jgi:hypothetical protein
MPAVQAAGGEALPELGRCTPAPPVKEGKKTVYHGAYTNTSCTAVSSAKTGKYQWQPGPGAKPQFDASYGAVTLETTGKTKLTCSAGTAAGEYTTGKALTTEITLTGCELVAGKAKCDTDGAPTGEIATAPLLGQIGFIDGGSKPTVGLELRPQSAQPLATFSCGQAQFAISGSVIAPLAIDKVAATSSLKYKASKGRQVPEHLEGAADATLTLTQPSHPDEQLGLTATATVTTEEPLETRALF